MKQREICPNCGATLPDPGPASVDGEIYEAVCPTCQFHLDLRTAPHQQIMTIDDLQAQLSALIERSQASGLVVDQIASTLGDALTFLTERVNPDHHFFVGIVDLGVTDSQYSPKQTPDLVEFLRHIAARRPENHRGPG